MATFSEILGSENMDQFKDLMKFKHDLPILLVFDRYERSRMAMNTLLQMFNYPHAPGVDVYRDIRHVDVDGVAKFAFKCRADIETIRGYWFSAIIDCTECGIHGEDCVILNSNVRPYEKPPW